MAFSRNQTVQVKSLKRQGVIVEVLREGRYKVAIGALSMECAEADLVLVAGSESKPSKSGVRKNHPALKPKSNNKEENSVDLHGLTVAEAMAEVERAIDRAIIEDVDRLRVLHGVGTGKIMDALHKYLKQLNVVSSFKLDQSNRGVTWVYF